MSADELVLLTRRLKREKSARLEAEAIAEQGLRDLYQRQQEILLLEGIAVAANEAGSVDDAMGLALRQICGYTGWPLGHAFYAPESPYNSEEILISTELWHGAERFADFKRITALHRFKSGIGLPGRVWASGKPTWINDVTADKNFPRAADAHQAGLRAAFAFPVLMDTEVVAVLEFFVQDILPPDSGLLRIMGQIGTQLGRVIERKRAKDRLIYEAHHDALTGLANRLNLLGRLEQTLASARRSNHRFAVVFLDLDRFKIINDTLGHFVGDHLLREVAERLTACCRESDVIARLGGDEFVVVLTGNASAEIAARQADKILRAIGSPYLIEGKELASSPSIGIAMFPDDGDLVDDLMKNADTAMYSAKAAGRNNFQFFTASMNEVATRRLLLEQSMRRALDKREFVVHYQPQIAIDGEEVVGFEALVRWRHPTEGMISPAHFIPVAEETGLIKRLGEYVLREALRELKGWHEEFGPFLRMAVNLSAYQLRDSELPSMVADGLSCNGVEPRHLELEITESVAMANPEETIRILNLLREMRIDLAVDDFGTGYSSLSYLKHLPIQRLKVDQSFVRDLETNPHDAAICTAIIALAHSMGLEVIADGVETEGQLAYLKKLGAHVAQGYLFSRPLPPEQAREFLCARHKRSRRIVVN